MTNITTKLPCAINNKGEVVYIEDAENGLACECFCPGCGKPLVAKNKGKIKEHHFAHKSKEYDCEHGYQSALHYIAKDLFMEMKYLTFRKNEEIVRYKIDSVVLEKRISDFIPDIIVTCDGRPFIVEIFVTHAVDDEKKAKIKEMMISAVEIDVSHLKNETLDKEVLKQELSNPENFSWVYDADNDLINQKKEIIRQNGLKIIVNYPGEYVGCPINVEHNTLHCVAIPFKFCIHCNKCLHENGKCHIFCGKFLSQRLDPTILVNENKIMFLSEFRNYEVNYPQIFEIARKKQIMILEQLQVNAMAQKYAYLMSFNNNNYPAYRNKKQYATRRKKSSRFF